MEKQQLAGLDGELSCGDTHHGIMVGFAIAAQEELMISPYFIEQVRARDVWSAEDRELLNEDFSKLPLWWESASSIFGLTSYGLPSGRP